jgi:hypothetical protein
MSSNVSEDFTDCIFRIEYYSILKMELRTSLEKFVYIYEATWRHIQEVRNLIIKVGCAIAQAVSSRLGFDPRSGHVRFVVDKMTLGKVFCSTSVSPADSHSIDCPTLIIDHLGLYKRPNSG